MTSANLLDPTSVRTGYVTSEGAELYYEVRGAGSPLLMIAGGGGDAGFFSLVAPLLAAEYKVITYDRRGNSRSSRHAGQNFEISQQSRDAVAVLHAVGETSAYVFGNSGGAIIALDMAKTQAEAIRAVIAHEPPTLSVLPDYKQWQRFFAGIYWLACTVGPQLAMFRFAFSLGIPWRAFARAPQDFSTRNDKNQGFFLQHEMLSFTNYCPDIAACQPLRAKIFMAVGQDTLDKKLYYGRPAPILAQQLGCALVIFPGNHISYLDQPEAWSQVLRTLLQQQP